MVNYYDNGNTWIRNIINRQDEQTHEVIMIQQQPKVSYDDQPTIAIITVNYYEKLAVDAMMSNKVTFVRHKPEGDYLYFVNICFRVLHSFLFIIYLLF